MARTLPPTPSTRLSSALPSGLKSNAEIRLERARGHRVLLTYPALAERAVRSRGPSSERRALQPPRSLRLASGRAPPRCARGEKGAGDRAGPRRAGGGTTAPPGWHWPARCPRRKRERGGGSRHLSALGNQGEADHPPAMGRPRRRRGGDWEPGAGTCSPIATASHHPGPRARQEAPGFRHLPAMLAPRVAARVPCVVALSRL